MFKGGVSGYFHKALVAKARTEAARFYEVQPDQIEIKELYITPEYDADPTYSSPQLYWMEFTAWVKN